MTGLPSALELLGVDRLAQCGDHLLDVHPAPRRLDAVEKHALLDRRQA